MPTLAEFLREYIDTKAVVDKWKPSTVKTYNDLSRQVILPALGSKEVSEIASRDFDRMVALMYKSGLCTRRVNMAIMLLRSVMRDAYRNKMIDRLIEYETKDRAKDADVEDGDEVVALDPFTQDEIESILRQLPEPYRAFFTVMAFTGCRPNELLALRWSNVNFASGELDIRAGRVRGTEVETGRTISAERKTKTYGVRQIPMVQRVRQILLKLNQERGHLSEHVFLDKHGKKLDDHHLYRPWGKAALKAGVRHRPCYQLRHSFAVNSLKGGVPLPTISRILGHSSVRTTISHYLPNTGQIEASDVAKLKEVFAS